MYKTSTDAYQAAAKIMSHEYANKYANYWTKKNKVIKTGKANFKDAGRQKTYNAEFAAMAEWKGLSKENMLSIAKKNKYDDVLKLTWSCWFPQNGKPCGKCDMCVHRVI